MKALAELKLRAAGPSLDDLLDPSFPAQNDFVLDGATFLAADTTRRAGKSNGLARKFFRAGLSHKNVLLPYIALTRDSAKNIMWPILIETMEKCGVKGHATESNLSVTLGNGSRIQLFGADQRNFIQRLRGIKTPLAAIDEGQSFRSHLEELVDDILTPAVSDFEHGQIVVTGTPGPVPKGFFYDITHGGGGFKTHKWSVFENPYMPRARQFVDDLVSRKGWDWEHPTIKREWLGQWVADLDALVYKYNEAKNEIDTLPRENEWMYVIGIDLGYDPDPTAFVVCAYSEFSPCLYIVETYKETRMILSSVAERTRYFMKKYPMAQLIVDAADKQAVEEMRQRHGLPLRSAEKHGKAGFIELMNSDLHAGHIKLLRGTTSPLKDEWANLVWDSESDRRIEDSRYENHLSDAALYAWRHCYNYVWRERPKEIDPRSEDAVDLFFEKEAEGIRRQKDLHSGEF